MLVRDRDRRVRAVRRSGPDSVNKPVSRAWRLGARGAREREGRGASWGMRVGRDAVHGYAVGDAKIKVRRVMMRPVELLKSDCCPYGDSY